MERLDLVWNVPMGWEKGSEDHGRILEVGCGTTWVGQDQVAELDVGLELDMQSWGAGLDRELERLTWSDLGE